MVTDQTIDLKIPNRLATEVNRLQNEGGAACHPFIEKAYQRLQEQGHHDITHDFILVSTYEILTLLSEDHNCRNIELGSGEFHYAEISEDDYDKIGNVVGPVIIECVFENARKDGSI